MVHSSPAEYPTDKTSTLQALLWGCSGPISRRLRAQSLARPRTITTRRLSLTGVDTGTFRRAVVSIFRSGSLCSVLQTVRRMKISELSERTSTVRRSSGSESTSAVSSLISRADLCALPDEPASRTACVPCFRRVEALLADLLAPPRPRPARCPFGCSEGMIPCACK